MTLAHHDKGTRERLMSVVTRLSRRAAGYMRTSSQPPLIKLLSYIICIAGILAGMSCWVGT